MPLHESPVHDTSPCYSPLQQTDDAHCDLEKAERAERMIHGGRI